MDVHGDSQVSAGLPCLQTAQLYLSQSGPSINMASAGAAQVVRYATAGHNHVLPAERAAPVGKAMGGT